MGVKNDKVQDAIFLLGHWLPFLNTELLVRQADKMWKNMLFMFIQLFLKNWNEFSVLFLLVHLLPFFRIVLICNPFILMSKFPDKRLEIKVNK